MTIGIAVQRAGTARAAIAGLGAVEAVGRGAIGGFVSLAALSPDGQLLKLDTQRGGAKAILASAGWGALETARHAVLMSSGPDRPEPLSQFTPADPAAGLMTGHRLPNMPRPDGLPPNMVALAAMAKGATPTRAIDAALSAYPDLDAGLIVMNLNGEIALSNSLSVDARDDIGSALVSDPSTGLAIGVLHNSIFPHSAMAQLAVSAIIDFASPGDASAQQCGIGGLAVREGDMLRALVIHPGTDRPVAFQSCDADWRRPEWEGCPVRRGDPVIADNRVVGRIVQEAYCILRDGTTIGTRGGDVVSWVERDQG
ncbi:DUF6963 family protein [Aliiruegeria lutimaris]|uniref:Uncharacterized protein n=1 Tax=Aliiruegeria lutimaris TaxID=571298 RepID=A0A1G8S607_9RHOB|nr:hypothetical protein [Aliiruegeria lutimaris]SDJ24621.1 hypothetical protein SAMN04488026_101465 [Aliiruegeria lutimaris]